MSDDRSAAEKALQSAKEQNRHTSEPAAQDSESDDDGVELQSAIRSVYAELDDGSVHPNNTVRDADLKALLKGLDDTGQLDDLVAAAADRTGRDPESISRGEALAQLTRLGLQVLDTDVTQTAVEARTEYVREQQSDTF